MLQGLTCRELAELEAYDRIEPFGPWREDIRAAYPMWRYATLTKGTYAPRDFMIDLRPVDKPAQSMEQMRSIFRQFIGKPNG